MPPGDPPHLLNQAHALYAANGRIALPATSTDGKSPQIFSCRSNQHPRDFDRGSRRILEDIFTLAGRFAMGRMARRQKPTRKIRFTASFHLLCRGLDQFLQGLVPDVRSAPFGHDISR